MRTYIEQAADKESPIGRPGGATQEDDTQLGQRSAPPLSLPAHGVEVLVVCTADSLFHHLLSVLQLVKLAKQSGVKMHVLMDKETRDSWRKLRADHPVLQCPLYRECVRLGIHIHCDVTDMSDEQLDRWVYRRLKKTRSGRTPLLWFLSSSEHLVCSNTGKKLSAEKLAKTLLRAEKKEVHIIGDFLSSEDYFKQVQHHLINPPGSPKPNQAEGESPKVSPVAVSFLGVNWSTFALRPIGDGKLNCTYNKKSDPAGALPLRSHHRVASFLTLIALLGVAEDNSEPLLGNWTDGNRKIVVVGQNPEKVLGSVSELTGGADSVGWVPEFMQCVTFAKLEEDDAASFSPPGGLHSSPKFQLHLGDMSEFGIFNDSPTTQEQKNKDTAWAAFEETQPSPANKRQSTEEGGSAKKARRK
eukprot:TRINITY_DN67055_c0_g1_i1.p1 TRINITY_DN67055_c0_g1~~TRINITY_DN67055_c0_g1_i1.p1  ORF type:complete len:414 (+),score=44.77 TRINITY_DN67055_c0_g1_i1:227-1468(+)